MCSIMSPGREVERVQIYMVKGRSEKEGEASGGADGEEPREQEDLIIRLEEDDTSLIDTEKAEQMIESLRKAISLSPYKTTYPDASLAGTGGKETEFSLA